MTYFARFLAKRNCWHFSHHGPPLAKCCFVKMFPLTGVNNHKAGLHSRLKKKIKMWVTVAPIPRDKSKSQGGKNDGEAFSEWCRSGNEALGPPCFANCSLHEDACFPNASFNRHIFSRTFVKPRLLLRVNMSAFKMACSSYPPSLMEMWKVWVTPFHKASCQGSWL